MCSAPCAPSTAPTASAACGCRCIAAASCALPVGPGAIWRRRVRSGARSSSARRPCSGLQPTGSASHTAASRHRGFPGSQWQQPGNALQIRSTPRAPAPARPDLAQQLAAFQAALPGSRGEAYLQQRGIPLALALQHGVGYAAPGTWPHASRDWRGGRVVFPHTTPDGSVVNLYGRAVGTAEQVPKAKRHDHLPGAKGYFNAAALHLGEGALWVCEGAFDALALLAAGISRVVAIFGVQGWRWALGRDVRERASLLWMPIRPGSSSGRRSRGRQHCGGGAWRCCLRTRMGGAKM